MKTAALPVPIEPVPEVAVLAEPAGRVLTAAAFHVLADVPPEIEWFANLTTKATRRTYKTAIADFKRFTGIARVEEFRIVTRAHVIAWRDDLQSRISLDKNGRPRPPLSATTIRNRLSALASLFDYLCNNYAVTHNPVDGVKRPTADNNEGKTPALGDHQGRELLKAPSCDTLKGKRDRAILAVLLYHSLRREELAKLRVKDARHARRGVPHLEVSGKGGKTRYMPLHPAAAGVIVDYLEASGHAEDDTGALFRPLHYRRDKTSSRGMAPNAIYELVRSYSDDLGFEIAAHALRATTTTNALEHEADITKVQQLLGHANIATTKLYDRRETRPEDSAVFKGSY